MFTVWRDGILTQNPAEKKEHIYVKERLNYAIDFPGFVQVSATRFQNVLDGGQGLCLETSSADLLDSILRALYVWLFWENTV